MGVDPNQQNAELLRIIGRNKERLQRSQEVLQALTGRTETAKPAPFEEPPAEAGDENNWEK